MQRPPMDQAAPGAQPARRMLLAPEYTLRCLRLKTLTFSYDPFLTAILSEFIYVFLQVATISRSLRVWMWSSCCRSRAPSMHPPQQTEKAGPLSSPMHTRSRLRKIRSWVMHGRSKCTICGAAVPSTKRHANVAVGYGATRRHIRPTHTETGVLFSRTGA